MYGELHGRPFPCEYDDGVVVLNVPFGGHHVGAIRLPSLVRLQTDITAHSPDVLGKSVCAWLNGWYEQAGEVEPIRDNAGGSADGGRQIEAESGLVR
jgi:hypothetical protein